MWIKDQNLGGLTFKSKLELLLSLARDKSTVKMNRLIVFPQRTGRRKLAVWNEIFAFWAAKGYGPENQSMVFRKLGFSAHSEPPPCSLRLARATELIAN